MRKPLDEFPTRLFVKEINVDTGQITEAVYTTQLVIDEADLDPLTPEMQALSDYWTKKLEEDLMRQLMGQSSDYGQSLRAAGVKV